jgi:hypothetical protein
MYVKIRDVCLASATDSIEQDIIDATDWKSADQAQFQQFEYYSTGLLNKVKSALSSLCCTKGCTNANQRTDIELCLQKLLELDCICETSNKCIPIRKSKGADFLYSWLE